ncbi:MAG: InlB B-repeat-containing protein [Christensenellales bacterium]
MKNVKKAVLTTIIAALLTLLLCSCSLFSNTGKTEKHSVILGLNGGSGVSASEFISGDTLVEPENVPTRSGYDFDGWYSDKELTVPVKFGEKITADVYIYAAWKERPFKAVFVVGGGQEDVTVTINDEGKFVAPAVSRTGYEFGGWFTDAALRNPASFDTEYSEDKTFYASWEALVYSITYDCDGLAGAPLGAKDSFTVADRIVLAAPSNIASGYEFVGWYDGEEKIVEIKEGTVGSITLKAKFISHNKAVVSVIGGRVSDGEVFVGLQNSETKIKFSEIITVSARASFKVFDGEGKEVDDVNDLPVGDTTFTIKVEAEDGTTAEYPTTVTRDDDSQVEVKFQYPDRTDSDFVQMGSRIEEPDEEPILGYTFDGWYADSAMTIKYNFNIPVLTSITIYAKYDAVEYEVIYHTGIWKDNPAFVKTFTVKDSTTLYPPLSKAEDAERYEFAGWYLSGGTKITSIPLGSTGNFEIWAKYVLKEENKTDYISAAGYSEEGMVFNSIDDAVAYMNWCAWTRKTTASFTVYVPNGTANPLQVLLDEFDKANDFYTLDATGASGTITENNKTEGGISYDKIVVTVTLPYTFPSNRAAEKNAYVQTPYFMHGFSSDRAVDYDGFPINSISDTVSVTDSEQLLYAVLNGYRPVPVVTSIADRIYTLAKAALREAVDDGMNDYEKAHAIYDWVVLNVYYDYDLLEKVESGVISGSESKTYNGFSLEGAFIDKRAVCDGISKAYALMCGMEGIECVQVVGSKVGGEGHAWNKFRIEGKWYNADPTAGGLLLRVNTGSSIESGEAISHRYFMLTDAEMRMSNVPETGSRGHADKTADTEYDFYGGQTFVYDGQKYDYSIKNEQEWNVVAILIRQLATENGDQVIDLEVYEDTESAVKSHISKAFSGVYSGQYAVFYDEDTKTVLIWLLS